MRKFACYLIILVIFFMGFSFCAQKTSTTAPHSDADSIQTSSTELALQGNNSASSLTSVRAHRNVAPVCKHLILFLFIIFFALFLGLKLCNISVISLLCLQFTAVYLLRLKIIHMQDGKKSFDCVHTQIDYTAKI